MDHDYRILVAIDFAADTSRLLTEAQRYGRALNAIVDIIHVAEPVPDFVPYIKNSDLVEPGQIDPGRDPHARTLRAEHQQTHAFATSLRAVGVRVNQVLTIQGPTLATILTRVTELSSDLLMLGSRQHGALYRLWYGDTVRDAANQASCALLVVPLGPPANGV